MSDRARNEADRRETRKPPRGKCRPQLEFLEGRQLLTASLASLPNVSSPTYLGYQVALDGSASNVAKQTFTVTSSNLDIGAVVNQGKFLTLNVAHPASSTAGDLTFGVPDPAPITLQLFDDLTPTTASKIEGFTTSGYYKDKIFHRVASGFPGPNDYIVQGGSPTGNGSGNSGLPGTPFADEFVQQLAFTGKYQLAMANAGPNTNDTQFFITTGAPAFLDFKHTIFGQVVSGSGVVDQMTKVSLKDDGSGNVTKPVSDITIKSAAITDTNPNGVIHIDTTQARAGETSLITVVATDPSTNTTQTQSFQVTVAPNGTATSLPLDLKPIAFSATQLYTANTPVTIQLAGDPANSATHAGQTLSYTLTSQPANGTVTQFDKDKGTLVYTPKSDFRGDDSFQFTVTNSGAKLTSDARTISLSTTPLPPTAAAVTQTVQDGGATTIQLTGNDQNPGSNQGLSYALTSQPTKGSVSQFNATTGTFVYTPTAGATGTDSFQYAVTTMGPPNPGLTSSPANVTINLVNTPISPTAGAVNLTIQNGTPTKVQLLGNSQNPSGGQALNYTLVSQPTKGKITDFNVNTGTFTYTPNNGTEGTDTFQYNVTTFGAPNPGLTSAAATVTINLVHVPVDTGAVRVIGTVLVVTPPASATVRQRNVINIVQSPNGTDPSQDKLQVFINDKLDIQQPLASNITRIVAYGSKGGDHITVDPSVDPLISVTLDGGHGNRHSNVLQAGDGFTREHGWFGKTTLIGGGDSNQLIGHAGRVKFRPTDATDQIFAGMTGNFERLGRRHPPTGTFYKRDKKGKLVAIPTPEIRPDYQDLTPTKLRNARNHPRKKSSG
jgi:cyclophilin family peptidyl-prolyl cis-trans isomerase